MKKQLLTFAIALSTFSPITLILCMESKHVNCSPHIISDIELTQHDIDECTQELKEKYTTITSIEDHELIREGIIDATLVIAQAKNNNTQEIRDLRKNLFEQYQKLGKCVHQYDYDSLHGAMSIDNRQENIKKYADEFNRVRKQDSHQFTLENDVRKIKEIEDNIRNLESYKKFFHERSIYAREEIKLIGIMQHIANLNEKNNKIN